MPAVQIKKKTGVKSTNVNARLGDVDHIGKIDRIILKHKKKHKEDLSRSDVIRHAIEQLPEEIV